MFINICEKEVQQIFSSSQHVEDPFGIGKDYKFWVILLPPWHPSWWSHMKADMTVHIGICWFKLANLLAASSFWKHSKILQAWFHLLKFRSQAVLRKKEKKKGFLNKNF